MKLADMEREQTYRYLQYTYRYIIHKAEILSKNRVNWWIHIRKPRFIQVLPSGKHTQNYGKSRFFEGKTHYKWPCSIAMFVYQGVYIYYVSHTNHSAHQAPPKSILTYFDIAWWTLPFQAPSNRRQRRYPRSPKGKCQGVKRLPRAGSVFVAVV